VGRFINITLMDVLRPEKKKKTRLARFKVEMKQAFV
jgi:hypothetical protein